MRHRDYIGYIDTTTLFYTINKKINTIFVYSINIVYLICYAVHCKNCVIQ